VDVICCMFCRLLCIRSGPSSGVHVYMQSSSSSDSDSATAADRPFSSGSWFAGLSRTPTLHKSQAAGVGGQWHEIDLARTDGRNFAQKLEAIMSCLMPNRTTVDATA